MMGQHNVNVKIDAADLQGLIPGITAIVMTQISGQMEDIYNSTGGEMGSIPMIGTNSYTV
ncbi:MAG: hypothetical protein ACKO7N_05540 [Candidatus Nitrosotenuis sp.]